MTKLNHFGYGAERSSIEFAVLSNPLCFVQLVPLIIFQPSQSVKLSFTHFDAVVLPAVSLCGSFYLLCGLDSAQQRHADHGEAAHCMPPGDIIQIRAARVCHAHQGDRHTCPQLTSPPPPQTPTPAPLLFETCPFMRHRNGFARCCWLCC